MSDQNENGTDRTAELEARLAEAQRTAEAAQRRRFIDLELMKAGAIDFEVAGELAERLAPAGGDAAAAVRELKRAKPYLFRPAAPAGAGAGAAPIRDGADPLAELARAARQNGGRRQLMSYLRARRAN